jgi:hypothetical protein
VPCDEGHHDLPQYPERTYGTGQCTVVKHYQDLPCRTAPYTRRGQTFFCFPRLLLGVDKLVSELFRGPCQQPMRINLRTYSTQWKSIVVFDSYQCNLATFFLVSASVRVCQCAAGSRPQSADPATGLVLGCVPIGPQVTPASELELLKVDSNEKESY